MNRVRPWAKLSVSCAATATLFTVLAACGGSEGSAQVTPDAPTTSASAEPEVFALSAELTIVGSTDSVSRLYDDREACGGFGSYEDFREGSQVVIADASGKSLSLTDLGWGRVGPNSEADPGIEDTDAPVITECIIGIDVLDIPSGAGPYTLKIGDRDPYPFNEAEAGSLRLTLK